MSTGGISLRVRPATPDDLGPLGLLEQECFPDDPWPTEALRPLLTEGYAAQVLVALHERRPVGYAVLSVLFEVAELQRIGAVPALRRHGVGTVLLLEAQRRSAQLGAERMLLEVREDNTAALRLYRDAGFGEIDRRSGYYRDGTDAIVLERELDPDDAA